MKQSGESESLKPFIEASKYQFSFEIEATKVMQSFKANSHPLLRKKNQMMIAPPSRTRVQKKERNLHDNNNETKKKKTKWTKHNEENNEKIYNNKGYKNKNQIRAYVK